MNLFNLIFLTIEQQTANTIIYIFEIINLFLSIIIIIISLLQNKKAQTGLTALNGGNNQLFSNNKERGLESKLSIFMLIFCLIIFIITLIIGFLTKFLL